MFTSQTVLTVMTGYNCSSFLQGLELTDCHADIFVLWCLMEYKIAVKLNLMMNEFPTVQKLGKYDIV
jgi:hypothetical protein